jgi:hypothetical protein
MSETGKDRSRRESLALVVAGFSLATAIVAGYLSYGALHEQRAVSIEGFAVANALGETKTGYGIRVSLVNESLRPVIVRSVDLMANGTKIGRAVAFTPEFDFLRYGSTMRDPGLEAQPPPIAVGERSVRTVAALLDFSEPADEAERLDSRDKLELPKFGLAFNFCRALRSEPVDTEFSLLVTLESGEARELPVTFTGIGNSISRWIMIVLGRSNAPRGIAVSRQEAVQRVRLVTLRIWTAKRGLIRSVTRPLYGSKSSRFPFRKLPRGTYHVGILEQGRVVGGGIFRVPLHPIYDRNVLRPLTRQPQGRCARYTNP